MNARIIWGLIALVFAVLIFIPDPSDAVDLGTPIIEIIGVIVASKAGGYW